MWYNGVLSESYENFNSLFVTQQIRYRLLKSLDCCLERRMKPDIAGGFQLRSAVRFRMRFSQLAQIYILLVALCLYGQTQSLFVGPQSPNFVLTLAEKLLVDK